MVSEPNDRDMTERLSFDEDAPRAPILVTDSRHVTIRAKSPNDRTLNNRLS
jgi:hypothetical protein